ncbi:MAG: hypothetical protein EBS38_03060 [Actinobacteria bacterium]|nr:hypothetical protein [Actinomycetota bacterium]
MARFAIVDNSIVESVVIADEGSESVLAIMFEDKLPIMETELTGTAWVGSEVVDGKFKPAQPFSSWVFDDASFSWQAPEQMPSIGDMQATYWNEETLSWVIVDFDPNEIVGELPSEQ